MNITAAIDFAHSLLGVPYGAWSGDAIPRDDSTPFYACNGPPPDKEDIALQGISCTGLTNVVRRFCGLSVPGVFDELEDYPGGTGAWYRFLRPSLTKYWGDPLPVGSLLFRPYSDFEDQGHVAIVVGDGVVLHSFPGEQGGVAVTPVAAGYYLYSAPPAAWLAVC
jgi:cell wall-associated NlpC family hydrolase